ncbi:MAG: tetratricopeptide repeat protein [candidate division Zixibacteria bacterium]|jgi:tetratricopeptide (TPR) repeat protein|nr:tetratricopeptide repeat protein [candidate division Zixibacteria bacterium]
MNVRTAALTTLIALLVVLGCAKTPEQKRDKLFQEGLSLLDTYRYTEADTTFREVLWTDTTSFLGPIGISLTQERQFFHWDALNFWTRISERNPMSLAGALGSMRVYRRLGLFEHALRRAAIAGSIDSAGSDVQAEAARLCLEMEQYESGRRMVRAAVAAGQPEAVASILDARALYMQGDRDSALACADRALQANVSSSIFNRMAADYFEERAAFDSAMLFSGRSLTSNESGFDEMAEHFFRALRVGYVSEARRLIDSVEAIGGVTTLSTVMDLYYSWATDQDFRGLTVSGLLARMQIPALSPLMYDAWAHRRVSNFTMVDGDLNAISNIMRRGNFEPAFRDFYGYYLALFRSTGYDPVGALRLLRDLHDRRFSDVNYALTELFLVNVTRQPELYRQMLDSLRQIKPRDFRYRTDLADVCADSAVQDLTSAAQLYDEALSLNPYYRPAFDGYWRMYDRQRRFQDALGVFERYPQFAELYPDLGVRRAVSLVKNKRADEGVALFLETFRPVSGDSRLSEEMVRWLLRVYRTADAKRIADALLEIHGDNVDALALAAETYNRIGDYEGALTLADRALERDPNNSSVRSNRAWSLYKLGRAEDAFAIFEDVYNTDPDNRTLLRFYAPALSESGRNKPEGENLARRGVFAGVDILEGWLNLCYVYMLNGRPDLAKGEAIRARNSFPYSPAVLYYLGYAEYLLKEDGAREHLEEAIEMGLQGEDLTRARNALSELS